MTDNMTYKEVLKPTEKMTMDMVKHYASAVTMSDEELSKSVKDILLQPYMENLYKGKIEPSDIAEFAEEMANASRSKKTSIVTGFAHSVAEADKNGDGNNAIGGNESLLLINTLGIRFANDIMKFADKKEMERTPPAPEPTKFQKRAGKLMKAFLKVGRMAVIAAGVAATSYVGYELVKESNDLPADKNKTEKKATPKMQKNDTTYTTWAKDAMRNNSR
jgi:hypothetical protein